MGSLLNKMSDLVTQEMEKAEVLNAAFASAFTSKTGPQRPQVPGTRGKVWSKEDGAWKILLGGRRPGQANWT